MSQNVPQFSVLEFSKAIKCTIENAFGYVKISGEITGFKKATSGHLYFNLKEENATLTAVCFRNQAKNIDFEIADGLQVCVAGQVTTFEGRSNYQIIVDKVEIAGIGAILEMIEKRKQKLMKEGLFDVVYKKPLPFFPRIVGVITSPTGAVIEDIKHRIADRCPLHLLIYPALVQGEKAANEIIAGIKYFNQQKINRPEVIIIARGGGSFEDLLPFSDENLVREAFKSDIPIVSAIGHETDFSLLDLVADVRAPTPTASAEFVTPVLAELKNNLHNIFKNILSAKHTYFQNKILILTNLHKNIISPQKYIEMSHNNLQNINQNINHAKNNFLQNKINLLSTYKTSIINPTKYLENIENKCRNLFDKIVYFQGGIMENYRAKLNKINLNKNYSLEKINILSHKADFEYNNIKKYLENFLVKKNLLIDVLTQLLRSCNYQQTLQRGFALVKTQQNKLIASAAEITNHHNVIIEMYDDKVMVAVEKKLSNNLIKNNCDNKKILSNNESPQSNFFDLLENNKK